MKNISPPCQSATRRRINVPEREFFDGVAAGQRAAWDFLRKQRERGDGNEHN
jgi:hypothetical protein